jgi:hypothetical protein
MEILSDLIKILAPAGLVLYGIYLTVRAFIAREFDGKVADLRQKNTEITIPVRLQAFERLILLLERIAPHSLVLRVNSPEYNVAAFQQQLLFQVREEFNHNVSQQIYVSNEAWNLVRKAMEDVIGVINISAQHLNPEAPGVELAREVLNNLVKLSNDPTETALLYLKDEVREIF